MTDNEIIKALECLCGGGDSCTECAYHKKYRFDECRKQVAKDDLDLINRLQAEIERLKKTEIEIDDFCRRLCRMRMLNGSAIASYQDLQNYIQEEKSKAIKEFSDRLKDYLRKQPKWNCRREKYDNVGFSYDDVFFGIDKIVKEMVGKIDEGISC